MNVCSLWLWYHVENLNLMEMKENREARVFHVVRLCEPTSTECSQWVTSLLYFFCMIFWMVTMYCEVSYLYIGLLTQHSYLTYVGSLTSRIFYWTPNPWVCCTGSETSSSIWIPISTKEEGLTKETQRKHLFIVSVLGLFQLDNGEAREKK